MGFFSNLFKPTKKPVFPTNEDDQFVLEAKEYLKSKQSQGHSMTAKDYFVIDILKGNAEKQFAKLLKKSLNYDNMYFNAAYPDVLWCATEKYASIYINLKNFNHNRVQSGDDVSIILSIDDATDDDMEYEDLSCVSIYLENNDEKSSDISDDDDEEVGEADAQIPLDKCPINVKNANFIYENAVQKVKEALIMLNII